VLADLIGGRPPSQAFDEDRLVQAAIFHGLCGYVVDALKDGRLRLGRAPRRAAVAHHLRQTARARALRDQLAAIVPTLERACGAPPIMIKGAALADALYPRADLRPFCDLDLVVPSHGLGAAVSALERSLGYRDVPEPWPEYGRRHGHHHGLQRDDGACPSLVELHWRVGDDPAAAGLEHGWLLEGSRPLAGAGKAVRVPSLERHLLVLSVHLLCEGAKRLSSVNDIALAEGQLMESGWRRAFSEAEAVGLSWVLHRALDYAGAHLHARRPRPGPAGRPPRWGPLRANERFGGWLGMQVGQLALGGWSDEEGYLRCAIRARRRRTWDGLRRWARHRDPAAGRWLSQG
jgi:hypothetical protein